MKHVAAAAAFGALIIHQSVAPGAQGTKTYRARLSPVPIDVAMQQTVAGSGTVTATLAGNRLTINGTFDGLKSPATIARLHRGLKGVRGPVAFDLTVTRETSGAITGTIQLTPPQVEDLARERYYVQLHSEKAPDGNLWGWLLPQETKR